LRHSTGLNKLHSLMLEMNPMIEQCKATCTDRLNEALLQLRFIDGLPCGWIAGDPWQNIEFGEDCPEE
jgi:hypothetical protein